VIAIDANQQFLRDIAGALPDAIATRRLTTVHAAIQSRDSGDVRFYLSNRSDWHSLDRRVAERDAPATDVIDVPARRLDSLFAEYGTPIYCKIDIEGADALALESLSGSGDLPRFISCEADCPGRERPSEAESLHTFDMLESLGYTRFELVDQESLRVLPVHGVFYRERWTGADRLASRLSWRVGQWWHPDTRHRMRLSQRHSFEFERDITGPWGDDLQGQWVDAATARRMYVRHRSEYYARPSFAGFGFWVDWHAARNL
jgi:FkbM family methyltransferase